MLWHKRQDNGQGGECEKRRNDDLHVGFWVQVGENGFVVECSVLNFVAWYEEMDFMAREV